MKQVLLTLITLVFLPIVAYAQPYPISTSVSIGVVDGTTLEDFYENATAKAILTDQNFNERRTYYGKLAISISGSKVSLRTKKSFFPPNPLRFNYNVPIYLSREDLAPYFNPEALDWKGYNYDQYLTNGGLPEGTYSVCIEVYDLKRYERPVSNRSCSKVFAKLNDPPAIISPIGEIPKYSTQEIQFNWAPMHSGAFPVDYTLTVWEKVEGLSNDQIIRSTLPFFDISTPQTFYTLNASDPLIEQNKKYIVRVKVKDVTGRNKFSNEGESKIETFHYPICDDELEITQIATEGTELCIQCVPLYQEGVEGQRTLTQITFFYGDMGYVFNEENDGDSHFNFPYLLDYPDNSVCYPLKTGYINYEVISTFANDLQEWIDDKGYGGVVVYKPFGGLCNESLPVIEVTNSGISFNKVKIEDCLGTTNQYVYNFSTECEQEIEYGLTVVFEDNCEGSEFEWSTGQTSEIIYPSEALSTYSVTVTCADGCEYILEDEFCLPGAYCDDGNPCTANDIYDIDCNCSGILQDTDNDGVCDADDACPGYDDFEDIDEDGIADGCDECPNGPNDIDEDEDGIPDACDPFITDNCAGTVMIVPQNSSSNGCDFCTSLLFPGQNNQDIIRSIRVVDPASGSNITFSQGSNNDNGIFNFPYKIISSSSNTCPSSFAGVTDFVNDLQSWIDAEGHTGTVIYDEFGAACSEGYPTIRITGTNVDFKFLFVGDCVGSDNAYTHTFTSNPSDCLDGGSSSSSEQVLLASLSVSCENPTYEWSNGELTETIPFENPIGSYSVTVTCGDCVYDSETDATCVVGSECNDYDECTDNDLINEFCLCVGQYVGDSDNDNVCDALDKCPGTDDALAEYWGDGYWHCPKCNDWEGDPCDDGLDCTINDTYDENCECLGEVADTDNDGICDAEDQCPGYNDFLDVDSDGIPDGCDVLDCGTGEEMTYCEMITAFAGCSNVAINDMALVSTIYYNLILDNFDAASSGVSSEGTTTTNEEAGNSINAEELAALGIFIDVLDLDGIVTYSVDGYPHMKDSDNDSVCDLFDIWPGGDDTYDSPTDGDYIPDCWIDCPAPLNNSSVPNYPMAIEAMFDRECTTTVDGCESIGIINCNCECEAEILDSDGDGVCDSMDECHGGDDNIDNLGGGELGDIPNGIPDACEPINCGNADDCNLENVVLPEGVTSAADACFIAFFKEYNAETGECECYGTRELDSDGDGVCDSQDQCDGGIELVNTGTEEEPVWVEYMTGDDNEDDDEDGIPDDCDYCPNPDLPGQIDDPCDDGNACTILDKLSIIVETTPLDEFITEAQILGMTDIYSIEEIIDLTGNQKIVNVYGPVMSSIPTDPVTGEMIYATIYALVNVDVATDCGCVGVIIDTDNDGTCDAEDLCPGWDDNDDYDGDGEPDGCDPPYYEVGCPISATIVSGNFPGILLTFEGTAYEQAGLPNPAAFQINKTDKTQMMIDDASMEGYQIILGEGVTEVFYLIEDLNIDEIAQFDGEPQVTGSVSFSEGQYCFFSLGEGVDILYPPFECPADGQYQLYNGNFTFGNIQGGIDPNTLPREIIEANLQFSNFGGTEVVASNALVVEDIYDPNGLLFVTDLLVQPSNGLLILNGATGSIEFEGGLTCTYEGGEVNTDYCIAADGTPMYQGQPCDDGDELTVYDTVVDKDENGICICVGDIFHDSDNDGVHDSEDLCPGGNDTIDDNQNGVPDACECTMPEYLVQNGVTKEPEVDNGNDIEVFLNPEILHESYTVTWTPDDSGLTGVTQPIISTTPNITIPNRRPGDTYSVSITGKCDTGFDSAPIEFDITIPEDPNVYDCAIITIPPEPDCPPAANLVAGDIVRAGDFMVTIGSISSGSGGTFSGSGYIEMPFFNAARVNVEFTGIEVVDCTPDSPRYVMNGGEMEVTGAGVALISEELADQINGILNTLEEINDVLGEFQSALETLESVVDQMESLDDYFSNGYGPLTDMVALAEELPYLPPGVGDGLSDAMDCMASAGEAEFAGCQQELTAAIAAFTVAMEELYNADLQVLFDAHKAADGSIDQTYGFDKQLYQVHRDNYYQIEDIAGAPYSVAWKSVRSGQTDEVDAKIKEGDQLSAGTLTFEQDGEEITVTQSGGVYTMSVTGSATHHAIEEIYVIQNLAENDHNHDDEDPTTTDDNAAHVHIAGKLNVISYDEKTVDLVLVPVGVSNSYTAPANLSDKLNDIYLQAGVTVNVEVAAPFDYAVPSQFPDLPSNWISAYSDDMNNVINAYKADPSVSIAEDKYYMFLIDVQHETDGKLGFMPKKRDFGFIFLSEIQELSNPEVTQIKTIAHELGHGAFILEHTEETYQDNPELNGSYSDNLMDKKEEGVLLHKYQWDLIHDPASNITLLDSDEEGEYTTVGDMADLISFANDAPSTENADASYTFVAPSGLPITIPANTSEITFYTGDAIDAEDDSCYSGGFDIYPFGTLRSFVSDGKNYYAHIECTSTGQFTRYRQRSGDVEGTPVEYVDALTKELTLTNTKAIVGFPCYNGEEIFFNVGQMNIVGPADPSLNLTTAQVTAIQEDETYRATGAREDFAFLANDSYLNKKQITSVKVTPAYNYEAQEFLKKTQGAAGCNAEESMIVFTHAHQISVHPEFYQICGGGEDFKFEPVDELTRIYDELIPLEFYPIGDGAYNTFGTMNVLEASEVNSWKARNTSIYKYFDDVLNNWETIFTGYEETSADDAQKLFDFLYVFRKSDCFFQNVPIEPRKKMLKMLSLLELTEENFYEFGILSEIDQEQEHLYTKLITTTPEADYLQILDLFKANSYDLFFAVADKLNDNGLVFSDRRGYESFVSQLYLMLWETENVTAEETGNVNADNIPMYVACDQEESPLHIIGVNNLLDENADKYTHTPFYIVSDKTIRLRSSKEIKVGEDDGDPIHEGPVRESIGSPYEYIVLEFDYSFDYSLAGKNISITKGDRLVVPYMFADYLFRKSNSAQFAFASRLALDALAIATIPLSNGLSSGLLTSGVRFLATVDGALAGVDALIFAPDSYQYDIYGESLISQEAHELWTYMLGASGVANIAGFVTVGANGLLKFTLNGIKNVYKTATSEVKLGIRQRLKSLRDEIGNAPPSGGTEDFIKWQSKLRELDALIGGLEMNKAIQVASGIEELVMKVSSQDLQAYIVRSISGGTDEALPGGYVGYTSTGDSYLNVGSRIIDSSPTGSGVEFCGTASSINIVEEGSDVVRFVELDIYKTVDGIRYVILEITDPIALQYPTSRIFYQLFSSTIKNWDWSNYTMQFAEWVESLSVVDRSKLYDIMSSWANGTGGNTTFAGLKADMFDNLLPTPANSTVPWSNESFRSFLSADVNRVGAYGTATLHSDVLATNANFLTKLTKDLYDPKLPYHTNVSVTQIRTGIKDPNTYVFYKEFYNSNRLGNGNMRKRYLEVIGLQNNSNRMALLSQFLTKRQGFYNLGAQNSISGIGALKEKNHVFGVATYKIAGEVQPPLHFVSVSGVNPSGAMETLIFTDNGINRIVIKNPEDAFVSGNFNNQKRFLQPTDSGPMRPASAVQWDTEAKALEHILDEIASAKNITDFTGNLGKRGKFQEVLDGTDLHITIKTEMEPCNSCAGVIKEYDNLVNQLNSSSNNNISNIDVEGGTLYHEPH